MITNKARFINIDKIELEITFTMTVSDWKEFRSHLSTHWPNFDIDSIIGKNIEKLLKQFDSRDEP